MPMLDAPELAKRLCAAMDYAEPVKIRIVDLAAKMGVSKQVVYEWRTTGRISKGRIMELAQATGTPLEYWLEPQRGTIKATKTLWARFGKAFAQAAVLALLVLNFALQPSSEATGGSFWPVDEAVYYVKRGKAILQRSINWLRRLLVFCHCFNDIRIHG